MDWVWNTGGMGVNKEVGDGDTGLCGVGALDLRGDGDTTHPDVIIFTLIL